MRTFKPYVRPVTRADLWGLGRELSNMYLYVDRMKRQEAGEGQLLAAYWPNDASPIGVIYIWTAEPEESELREPLKGVPLLMHLTVLNEMRHRGVGAMLVRAAEDRLREQGYEWVALGVEPRNDKAVRLYEKLGYRKRFDDVVHTTHVEFRRRRQRTFPETCLIYVKNLVWPDAYVERRTVTAPALASVG